jgi:hypothetical protein
MRAARSFSASIFALSIHACGSASSPEQAPSSESNATSLSPVSVQVTTQTIGAPIDAHFAGLSYEKGYLPRPFFTPDNQQAIALFRGLGKNLLRVGGGTCDDIAWTPQGPGGTLGQVAKPDVAKLAAFLDATDWDVIYCVNLKTSTPDVAAEEAAFAAETFGGRLMAIEIGNEPDNYGNAQFAGGWGPDPYAARWSSFATAIHNAVPEVPLTAPALAELQHDSSWLPPLLDGATKPDLVTQHFYASEIDRVGTIGTLVSPGDVPYAELGGLDGETRARGLPYRMAETSTFWGGGIAGVSDRFASALWAIDYLFAIAAHDGVGANFHSISTHPNSVLADENGTITEVRPIYHGLSFFTLAGVGSVLETTQDAGGLNVIAHALLHDDGSTAIFVSNKTPDHPIAFRIDLGHPVSSASLQKLSAPSLDASDGIAVREGTVTRESTIVSGTLEPASVALIVARD